MTTTMTTNAVRDVLTLRTMLRSDADDAEVIAALIDWKHSNGAAPVVTPVAPESQPEPEAAPEPVKATRTARRDPAKAADNDSDF